MYVEYLPSRPNNEYLTRPSPLEPPSAGWFLKFSVYFSLEIKKMNYEDGARWLRQVAVTWVVLVGTPGGGLGGNFIFWYVMVCPARAICWDERVSILQTPIFSKVK